MFTSYELTEKEELTGSILTELQKCVLQNELSRTAMEKNLLTFDTEKPAEFSQNEAYLRGKIDLLSYLLENSTIANDTLNNPNYEFHNPQ